VPQIAHWNGRGTPSRKTARAGKTTNTGMQDPTGMVGAIYRPSSGPRRQMVSAYHHNELHSPERKTMKTTQGSNGAVLAPSTVRGFRLLDRTDLIEAGDQVLGDDCETWWDIPEVGQGCLGHTWMIGKRYEPGFFQPMRRIDSANDQGHGPLRRSTGKENL